MKTILLTGATGFVGTQILKSLKNLDVRIILAVRKDPELFSKDLANIEKIVSSPNIFQESTTWWSEKCKGVDTLIHTAWYVEPGKYLLSDNNMECLIGSLNLAKGAAIAGIKKFIGIGTCFEYELSSGTLTKDTPLNPLTPYAAAKAALYMGLSQWLPTQSIDLAWCRLFYLYGEGEDERRLVPYLHRRLANGDEAELSSGRQVRDFMDVSKAGKIIADVAMGNQTGVINICSGVPISVRELAEQIADTYGRRELLRFGRRPDNIIDPPRVVGIPNYHAVESKI